MPRLFSIFLCAGIFFPSSLCAESAEGLRERAEALEAELEALPKPLAGPAGGTLGYASELSSKEIGKAWENHLSVLSRHVVGK